ncbi:recombinase family protein [Paenibacillus sp. GYB006]|uniref:recombinase family protein n=1 Tax=Paenibacillus sp. GYB006 TaxID=2994394 RepID=UPI002F96A6A3
MYSVKMTVAYVRNSADVYQDNSIQLQKDQAYICATKHSLTIDDIYNDSDTSAVKHSIEGRKDLSRLLNDIRKGLIGTLIVYKRDRLARKTDEYMEIYEILKQHQVTVYFSASNEFPMLYTPQAFTIEYLLASFAEHEEIQMKQRIADGNASKFSEGKLIPPKIPFGYIRCTKETSEYDKYGNVKKVAWIIIDPPAAEIVKQIFNELLTNSFETMTEFRYHLSSLKLTRNKKGKPLQTEDIKQIIRQPLYKGLHQMQFQFQERPSTKFYHELIIVSEDNWTRAQIALSQLTQEKRIPRKNNLSKKDFFLSNIIKCQQCIDDSNENHTLKSHIQMDGINGGYYVCKKHKIKLEKQKLEHYVVSSCISFFTQLIQHKPKLKSIQKSHIQAGEMYSKKLNERLEKLTLVFSNLTKEYINEPEPVQKSRLLKSCNETRDAMNRIRDKINELNSKIGDESKLIHFMESDKELHRKFTDIDSESKSRLIEDILDTILVDHDGNLIPIFKIPHILTNTFIGGIINDIESSRAATE